MKILEADLISDDVLNSIAIEEFTNGVLNIDDLVDEDEPDVVREFYRNVNLANRY